MKEAGEKTSEGRGNGERREAGGKKPVVSSQPANPFQAKLMELKKKFND